MASSCFVIMPFRPEFAFLWLYLERYLLDQHNIVAKRGDSDVLTKPLLEKVTTMIAEADVVIADITGRNPNVFFEIGWAHSSKRPIIFITQEDPKDNPIDIGQFECIRYDPRQHRDFLDRLDNALRNLFLGTYKDLHSRAVALLKEFKKATGVACAAVDLEEFRSRVIRAERTDDIPRTGQTEEFYKFALPRIADTNDLDILAKLNDWIRTRFPAP
jgi:hypothetical protein